MEVKNSFVFQADDEVVNSVYENDDNYIVEYDNKAIKEYCILYFSSNNIYFPNSPSAFEKNIVKKNRYEWYANRITGYKHIFLRDIKKQWYVSGINSTINTPKKLLEFLMRETSGFKIITLGSSAGGFAAILYGQLLNAELIYSFNGQFEVKSLLKSSNETIDPLLFRNQENKSLLPYFDVKPFIKKPQNVYYFHSRKSKWDGEQRKHVDDLAINVISFNTKHHGIPFLKSNLSFVLNSSEKHLRLLSSKNNHPIVFSIKAIGFVNTVKELKVILFSVLKNIFFKESFKS